VDSSKPGGVYARVGADGDSDLPGLRLRIHRSHRASRTSAYGSDDYVDMLFEESVDVQDPCGVAG
jgi:hypothetical protein